LLKEVTTHGIEGASVYLNSPGGDLMEGVELGRLIRRFGFDTYVGQESSEEFKHLPGQCYSACVLAFVGGRYRYDTPSSKIGVHRFYTESTTNADMDIAQILSATITNYLTEMDVDIGLFDRMSKAGKNEIYVLGKDDLKKLRVVNDGRFPAKWTIEVREGTFYLRGEQRTRVGGGKVIFICTNTGEILFMPMYGPINNANLFVNSAVRYSMRFGDGEVPLPTPVQATKPQEMPSG
jgi:hypothetical protein